MDEVKSVSSAAMILESIQKRMAGVSEEEIERALQGTSARTVSVGSGRTFTFRVISEQEARPVSASTRTASSRG